MKAVEDGVRIYDPSKTTSLCTDWSKTGIGFLLLQKECICEIITPVCCPSGWTLIYAGSRFTSPAESRYATVEVECLAAAWALEKTKYFILGAPSLFLAVDHKPLLKILGDKSLQDIHNPRLQTSRRRLSGLLVLMFQVKTTKELILLQETPQVVVNIQTQVQSILPILAIQRKHRMQMSRPGLAELLLLVSDRIPPPRRRTRLYGRNRTPWAMP